MERATYNPPDGYAATLPFKEGKIFLKESYRKKIISKGAVKTFVFLQLLFAYFFFLKILSMGLSFSSTH